MAEGHQSGDVRCVAQFMSLQLGKGIHGMDEFIQVCARGEKRTNTAVCETDRQSIDGEGEKGRGRRTQERVGS